MKKTNAEGKDGKGTKSRFAVEIQGFIELPGEERQEFKMAYDISVTMESVEYAVQQVAGAIARIANKVAAPDATAAS